MKHVLWGMFSNLQNAQMAKKSDFSKIKKNMRIIFKYIMG